MIPPGYKLQLVYSGRTIAPTDPVPLSEISRPCDALILSVWAVLDDANDTIKPGNPATGFLDNDKQEIYWGMVEPVHPLYPSDTTYMIWTGNAQDIAIRCNKQQVAEVRVGFSLFKLVPIEEKES